jgi:hypothetical protein
MNPAWKEPVRRLLTVHSRLICLLKEFLGVNRSHQSLKEGVNDIAKDYWNLTNTGDTFSSALRQFTDNSIRRLYFPHNKVLIKVSFLIKIKEEDMLHSQSNPKNLTLLPVSKVLGKVKKDAIHNKVMSALKKAKKLNAGIIGFGEIVHKKFPKQ